MAVWTIAAQEGTGGARLAAELAAAAGVPLFDRAALALFARRLDPDFPAGGELAGRFGGRLNALALSTAIPDRLARCLPRGGVPTQPSRHWTRRRDGGGPSTMCDLRSGCFRCPIGTLFGSSCAPSGAAGVADRGLSA